LSWWSAALEEANHAIGIAVASSAIDSHRTSTACGDLMPGMSERRLIVVSIARRIGCGRWMIDCSRRPRSRVHVGLLYGFLPTTQLTAAWAREWADLTPTVLCQPPRPGRRRRLAINARPGSISSSPAPRRDQCSMTSLTVLKRDYRAGRRFYARVRSVARSLDRLRCKSAAPTAIRPRAGLMGVPLSRSRRLVGWYRRMAVRHRRPWPFAPVFLGLRPPNHGRSNASSCWPPSSSSISGRSRIRDGLGSRRRDRPISTRAHGSAAGPGGRIAAGCCPCVTILAVGDGAR